MTGQPTLTAVLHGAPSETWYCSQGVTTPTDSGDEYLIWAWNGNAADYPLSVGQVRDLDTAALICNLHNIFVPQPPDFG